MAAEGPDSELLHFVEEMGLSFEHLGLPRMAGRMLGWLLICDPPSQSPGELASVLQASKSSISTAARLLIQCDLIERVSLPGLRRDYFRMKPGAWTAILQRRMGQLAELRDMAQRGLAMLDDQLPPERRQRLEEMYDFYTFFQHEFPALLQRWEQQREVIAS